MTETAIGAIIFLLWEFNFITSEASSLSVNFIIPQTYRFFQVSTKSTLCLFAVFHLIEVLAVDPFLRKSAVAANVSVYVDGGKDRTTYHYVVSRPVSPGKPIDPDDVRGLTLGAYFRVLHRNLLSSRQIHYTIRQSSNQPPNKKLRLIETEFYF